MRIDSVAGPDEAAEAVAEGAVRAFEQPRLTGVRRVRTVAVAGVHADGRVGSSLESGLRETYRLPADEN